MFYWALAEVYKVARRLEASAYPFANLPEKKGRLYALTAERMKNCRWIKPEIVAQIEFAEWTRGQPSPEVQVYRAEIR
jgi:bifunctional non-homologous end joining protein LigD